MSRYSVIPSRVWQNASGRTASPYGALPWWSEAQREREGWEMVIRGWTLSDNVTNTVGLCRVPYTTEGEARAAADEMNAAWDAAQAKHAAEWAPINAPIVWTKSRGNDGIPRWHSGEGYSIACDPGSYAVEHNGKRIKMWPFRALAKAKAWAESCIRSERRERAFT